MRTDYDLLDPPGGTAYRSLLRWLASRAPRFGLVFPDAPTKRALEQPIAVALAAWLERDERANRWPGTRERGAKHRVALFRTCDDSIAALVAHGPSSLYDWVPSRAAGAEDLFFLRADGSPILTTVAHERMAWLSLTPAEANDVASHVSIAPPQRA